MSVDTRRNFFAIALAVGFGALTGPVRSEAGPYICPPCGCAADGRRFQQPGFCPACGMRLVPLSAATSALQPAPFEPSRLETGTGKFEMSPGSAPAGTRLIVHYYKPRTFSSDSPILIVVAGAGRNADAYRDAWIAEADRNNLLVAAPSYPQATYDFARYQMGGVIDNLVLDNMPAAPGGGLPAHIHLRDEDIRFNVNSNSNQWIFQDFDRLFALLVAQTGSGQSRYDLFGHSAGGQILHRHVLFHPHTLAGRIVAANAGLYTLPDLERPPLLGMAGTGATKDGLRASLRQKLMILVGEEDIGAHNGGTLLHTPLIDTTGIDRLARARYFYDSARQTAARLHVKLGWTLSLVPNTGHDFRAMSRAASRLLYPTLEPGPN